MTKIIKYIWSISTFSAFLSAILMLYWGIPNNFEDSLSRGFMALTCTLSVFNFSLNYYISKKAAQHQRSIQNNHAN